MVFASGALLPRQARRLTWTRAPAASPWRGRGSERQRHLRTGRAGAGPPAPVLPPARSIRCGSATSMTTLRTSPSPLAARARLLPRPSPPPPPLAPVGGEATLVVRAWDTEAGRHRCSEGGGESLVALVNTSAGPRLGAADRCLPSTGTSTSGCSHSLPSSYLVVTADPWTASASPTVQPDAGGRGPRRAPAAHSPAPTRDARQAARTTTRRSSHGRSTRCQCARTTPAGPMATVAARDPDLGPRSRSGWKVGRAGGAVSLRLRGPSDRGHLRRSRSFDYETLRQLDVRIQASGGELPQLSSSALVQVRVLDQNDHADPDARRQRKRLPGSGPRAL